MDKTTIMQIKKWKRSTVGYQKNSSHKSNKNENNSVHPPNLFPSSSLSLMKVRN
jgi:hypothetical protein